MPEEKSWFIRAVWGAIALIAVLAVPSCFNEAKASPLINYNVQGGDTLSEIAKRFCGDYRVIAAENGIADPNRIYAGRTVLRLKNQCHNSSPQTTQSVSPERFAQGGGASQEKRSIAPSSSDSRKSSLTSPPPSIAQSMHHCPTLLATDVKVRRGVTRTQVLQCIDQEYGVLIRTAAQYSGISPEIIRAKIYVESSGNPHAISAVGCRGLLQVCPGTAKGYGVSESRLLEPGENVLVGARIFADYLRLARGNENLALAYYYAGPYSRTVKQPGFDPASLKHTQRVREIMRS